MKYEIKSKFCRRIKASLILCLGVAAAGAQTREELSRELKARFDDRNYGMRRILQNGTLVHQGSAETGKQIYFIDRATDLSDGYTCTTAAFAIASHLRERHPGISNDVMTGSDPLGIFLPHFWVEAKVGDRTEIFDYSPPYSAVTQDQPVRAGKVFDVAWTGFTIGQLSQNAYWPLENGLAPYNFWEKTDRTPAFLSSAGVIDGPLKQTRFTGDTLSLEVGYLAQVVPDDLVPVAAPSRYIRYVVVNLPRAEFEAALKTMPIDLLQSATTERTGDALRVFSAAQQLKLFHDEGVRTEGEPFAFPPQIAIESKVAIGQYLAVFMRHYSEIKP